MSLGEASEWTLHAKCRNMADALFPEGKDQKKVRGICMSCPVRLECLAEALDNRERRQLLRSRPDITSWREVLLTYGRMKEAS